MVNNGLGDLMMISGDLWWLMMVNDMITTDLGGPARHTVDPRWLAGGDLHMARHDPYARHEKGEIKPGVHADQDDNMAMAQDNSPMKFHSNFVQTHWRLNLH